MERHRPIASGVDTGPFRDPRRWHVPLRSVTMPNDPDGRLVAVQVKCSSKGPESLLRVPPGITTCAQAVAWTMGIEEAEECGLVIEA